MPKTIQRYSPAIMERVRQNLGLKAEDESRDTEIIEMSPGELFNHCLIWEGIIGYTYTIRSMVEEIYRIKLPRLTGKQNKGKDCFWD